MSLEDDLKSLSEAHGPKALAKAFARVQGTIRTTRRAASKKWGLLASTFAEAMRIWDTQKAEGVPRPDRVAGLEKSLREAWPKGREHEWDYRCSKCNDYGLEMHECPGDATCGRTKTHQPHEYGTPCWCPAGARHRDKPKPEPQDFAQAGKSKPSRIGR